MEPAGPTVKRIGRVAYADSLRAMQAFTAARTPQTPDEIWLCEHPPVYTQGVGARPGQLHGPTDLPVVRSDRGGQITHHGPGQVVAYALIDLRRLGIFVKEYVYRIEHGVLQVLDSLDVTGHRVPGAPGVYVRPDAPGAHERLSSVAADDPFAGLAKIAALGVKLSRHCAYHGVALNVAMDLQPYALIDPCGYAGLATTDLRSLGVDVGWDDVADRLGLHLARQLAQR